MKKIKLINLLQKKETQEFFFGYAMRFSVLFCIGLVCVTLVHATLLFPSYVFLKEEQQALRKQLTVISQTMTPEEMLIQERLNGLEVRSVRIEEIAKEVAFSDELRRVLAVPREGIILSGFVFSRGPEADIYRLFISGTASTRLSLRTYDTALRQVEGVIRTNLPINAFAQENNISFTIEFVGKRTIPLSFP